MQIDFKLKEKKLYDTITYYVLNKYKHEKIRLDEEPEVLSWSHFFVFSFRISELAEEKRTQTE